MGLSDYRKYKREQELKASETISLLTKRIEALEKEILALKEQKTVVVPRTFTEDEKKTIEEIQRGKTKPEDFISLFTGNIEEFKPNA